MRYCKIGDTMKIFQVITLAFALLFFGCAQNGKTEVGPNATHYIMTYETGVVRSIRPVIIKDNGTGTFIGAITGVVLGSMIGRGNGTTLATLAGGLGGAYAGGQLGKANAQELTVQLDNYDQEVVVIVKGESFTQGEHIRIVKRNGRVSSVEPF
jgi:outer membrane lipoprotein SlyB